MDLIAAVCPVGYSNGLLSHDPSLVEGLPVRDTAFVVQGRTADVDGAELLPNPGFEDADDHRLPGWDWQDEPGKVTFADSVIKRGGKRSLRMENIGADLRARQRTRYAQDRRGPVPPVPAQRVGEDRGLRDALVLSQNHVAHSVALVVLPLPGQAEWHSGGKRVALSIGSCLVRGGLIGL